MKTFYDGTFFRFPLRSQTTAKDSEIKKQIVRYGQYYKQYSFFISKNKYHPIIPLILVLVVDNISHLNLKVNSDFFVLVYKVLIF